MKYIFLFIICCATLFFGHIPFREVLEGVYARLFYGSTQFNPLLDERLPRLIILLSSGASLAVSGAVMQALFQNPLASPSVLGITAGGSLAATVVIFFQEQHLNPYCLPLAAFTGALLTLFAIYFLAKDSIHGQMTSLVLTGIAISTLLYALQNGLCYAFRDNYPFIQTMTEWLAGSTTDKSFAEVHMQLPLTLIGLSICMSYREELNILSLGHEEATVLGIDVKSVRLHLFLAVALLTAGTLAAMGTIGFFGLILPHLVRTLCGPDNRLLIPISIILGGTTLAILDLLLRIADIHALSIGNVSSMIGALFFFIILQKQLKGARTFYA